ncbi:MAG: DNA-binding IclR family transcriptional regulator [Paracoccaceae bacterium]|jgi:DNA-binding IclR family transcriptional regulator
MTGASGSGERILAILDVFTEERLEWTPGELMERLGYSRPTLYRYLKLLKEAGFLSALPNRGYTLGPRVVELDFLMRQSDPVVDQGAAEVDGLAARHPCSALLVRFYGDKLLCVKSACSIPNPVSSYPRGRPMPLARGAISRAILAFLPRRQQAPLIEARLADMTATGLGETVDDVIVSLRKVRRSGIAIAHGEVTPGVVGIAAPVFDAGRAPIAALCMTIAASEVGTGARTLTALAADVKRTAEAISAALSDRRDEAADCATHQATFQIAPKIAAKTAGRGDPS